MTDRYYGEAGSYLTFMDKGEMKERKLDAATLIMLIMTIIPFSG